MLCCTNQRRLLGSRDQSPPITPHLLQHLGQGRAEGVINHVVEVGVLPSSRFRDDFLLLKCKNINHWRIGSSSDFIEGKSRHFSTLIFCPISRFWLPPKLDDALPELFLLPFVLLVWTQYWWHECSLYWWIDTVISMRWQVWQEMNWASLTTLFVMKRKYLQSQDSEVLLRKLTSAKHQGLFVS